MALAVALVAAAPTACRDAPIPKTQPRSSAPPAAPAHGISVPPQTVGARSLDPPRDLPPARTCVAALGEHGHPKSLPGQVDGRRIEGRGGLQALREAWGDALVVVQGGDFSGWDLSSLHLHNICFVETKLTGADLRAVQAKGVGFVNADLVAASLEGARMPGVLFRNTDLERARASGADLSDGLLDGSALAGWKDLQLDGADLRRFRFDCGEGQEDQCAPYWEAVSFRNADLRGAKIDTHWGDADFTGARLAGTRIGLKQVPLLAKARIEGTVSIREGPASVQLAASEFAWLRRHVAPASAPAAELPAPIRGPAPRARRLSGGAALFVTPPLHFDPQARRSPLYRRLMPVIVAGTRSYVYVEEKPGGAVSVVGAARGANYHPCNVSGPPLRRDLESGWYEGPSTAPRDEGRAWSGPSRPVLLLWEDRAEIHERGHPEEFTDYITCGARASFDQMQRVSFPIGEARRLWRARF